MARGALADQGHGGAVERQVWQGVGKAGGQVTALHRSWFEEQNPCAGTWGLAGGLDQVGRVLVVRAAHYDHLQW